MLRRVFTITEVADLSAEADRLLEQTNLMTADNMRVRFTRHVNTGEQVFDVFDPFLDLAPVSRRLALDARILDPLASIYRERACLFKDKLIYKAPGSEGAHLHQDYIAWPRFPRSFVTVILAIDAFEPGNGCTELFPGIHRRGYLSPADGQHYQLDESLLDGTEPAPLLLAPGDVALFGCFTPHRSKANASQHWRRGLFLSYNADSDGGDQRQQHYQDFHDWLRKKHAVADQQSLYFR